ncbi:hypothetical protein BH10PSE18_BH10PSE18_15130 [soil metagenome]
MNGRTVLITQAEYARRRGVAKSAVAKAVSEGRISLIDGKVNEQVANIQWEQNTRARGDSQRGNASPVAGDGQPAPSGLAGATAPSAPPAEPPAKEPGYNELRTRREMAAVEREERENAKEAGRLVDRDTVERAVFDGFRQLRDAVMNSAQRISPKVIGINDARDVEQIVAGELRKAFQGWETQMLERLPKKEPA